MSVNVFISYSHKDARYLADDSLVGFLRGLERDKDLDVKFWCDTALVAGTAWDSEIKRQIEEAHVAVILVSQWFLDSEYCRDVEISGLLQLCRDRGLVILPVILSACEWERHEWLCTRQFLPRGGETLEEHYADLGRQKRLYFDIRQDLRKHIEATRQSSAPRRSGVSAEAHTVRAYRSEVERALRAHDGELSAADAMVLAAMARKLKLRSDEAAMVEAAARNELAMVLDEFEQGLRAELRQVYPLTEADPGRLARLRHALGLEPSEVAHIETRLAALPAKLARYDQALEKAMAMTYPLTEAQTVELTRLQHVLGLNSEDVLAIQSRVAFSADWFFGEIVPKVLEIRRSFCRLIGGRYGFRLHGKVGGEWTIDYGEGTVSAGINDDVNLYFEMSADAFTEMLDGRLDVEAELEAGRIKILGRTDLFVNLVVVFDTTGTVDVTPVFIAREQQPSGSSVS